MVGRKRARAVLSQAEGPLSLSNALRERGQILVMAAILLPVLLGMAGMAVDVGSYSSERRSLQNAADSIALAAGQELPDASAVQARADEYAAKHDVDLSHLDVTVTGGTTEPRVRVEIDKGHDFIFMGILGIENADVGAVASRRQVFVWRRHWCRALVD